MKILQRIELNHFFHRIKTNEKRIGFTRTYIYYTIKVERHLKQMIVKKQIEVITR